MSVIPVDDASMDHTGPTLPTDFPPHLLIQICEAILAPLLSPYSPLKPYTKPWGRSAPSPWSTTMQSTSTKNTRFYSGPSNWTDWKGMSKGSSLGNCKNDVLAFAYCNKRLWSICGEMPYRHVRVSNLAVGDVLVSRRNLLRNTRVLEIYITREVETSQAQTDLNLCRLFIQSGIILLWAPLLHTILVDLRAVPSDQQIWNSFLSRLRQRLFIDHVPGLTSAPPQREPIAEINVVAGAGQERSTSIDPTARWGDSQGVLISPEKVSIPNFAIGMGYSAAGEVESGFGGVLDILFSPNFPLHPSPAHRGSNVPHAVIGGTMIRSPIPGRLDALTSLDLLVPRPSWGHEESEGFAFGLTLRRLRGLKQLGLHADGVIQNNTTNYVGFGLKRKPPFGTTDPGVESEEEEADMAVDERGMVIYPTRSESVNKSLSGGVTTGGGGPTALYTSSVSHDGGYGPETWWAGVLNALTYPAEDLVDPEQLYPLTDQAIEEFRISVSVPGGNVPITDFDAFFYLVVPYFHKMAAMKTLVFDMVFPLPQDQFWSTDGRSGIKALVERQRHYVEKLVDPFVPNAPLMDRPILHHHQHHHRSEPHHARVVASGVGDSREQRTQRASTLDSHHRPVHSIITAPESAHQQQRLQQAIDNAASQATATYSKSIRHVYFGDYHGLPNLPPMDLPRRPTLTPDASQVILSEGFTEPSKSKPTSAGKSERTEKRRGGGNGTDKDATAIGGVGVDVGNQRVVPGLWWTIKNCEGMRNGGETPLAENVVPLDGLDILVVQGWEEVLE